jgi:TolA-binding protein
MLMVFTPLFSQITLGLEQPDLSYIRALKSYEKGLYNQAIRGFEKYIKKQEDGAYLHESHYYISSSRLRLLQEGAIVSGEEFMAMYPNSSREPFIQKEMGDFYFQKKRYRQAYRYYKNVDVSILGRDETDDFLFRKGYCFFEAEKFDEAKDVLYPLTLRPSAYQVKATYYYGYVCYQTKDYEEALKAFLSILDKGPQTMKLYICQIYYLKGDYANAISFAESVNLGKLEDEKYTIMGKSHFRLRNYEKASEYFSKAFVSYDKLTEDEIYEIGYSYYKMGDCNKSFTAFEKIAFNGTAVGQLSSYHLGDCFVKKGKKQNAYNAFFEAQRTDFDKEIKENAMFNMGKLAFDLEDYKTAISTFHSFIEKFPKSTNSVEAQKKLAELFLVTNDYRSAIPMLESIPDLDTESRKILHQIYILRGEELMLLKDRSNQAFDLFKKASQMNSEEKYRSIALFWLGELAFNKGNKSESGRYYQLFLASSSAKQTPYYTYAHYAMGYSFFDVKKFTEALPHFNRYIQLARQHQEDLSLLNDAYLRAADCYYSAGNYGMALDHYSFVSSKRSPGSDYALFQQGIISGIQGKSNQKIQFMKQVIERHSSSLYVEHAIFEIASEWVVLNNFKEAERNFRYLLADYSHSSYAKRSYFALGVMYYTQEKDDQALEEFKYVVEKYPGTSESKLAIGYVERIYVSRGESNQYLAWLEKVPNSNISVSFRDSVTYQGAFNLYASNQYAGAINGFKKYLSEFPNGNFHLSASFYLAQCLENTSGISSAIGYLRLISGAIPSEFREESTRKLADYYFNRMKNCDSAIFYFGELEKFSSDRQNLMTAYLGQIRCASELKDDDLLRNKGQRLLKMDNIPVRVFGEVNNRIGKTYYFAEDYVNADLYFKSTLERNKDDFGAEAYYYTAQILFDRMYTDEAKKRAFEYSKTYTTSDHYQARIFLLIAEIYEREGDTFNAKATVNFVNQNYKEDPYIQELSQAIMKRLNK